MEHLKEAPAGARQPGGNPIGQSKDSSQKSVSNKAVEFIQRQFRGRLVNLVAIPQEGGLPVGITRPGKSPDLEAFIEEHNGRNNLYFMPNEPKPGSPDKKLSEDDVAKIHYVYSDVDPKAGKDFKEERKRIRHQTIDLCRDYSCPPTFVIDSGGGNQHFWKLSEPLDAKTHKQTAKNLGAAIRDQLDGDNVQNIDRIMRLPGTKNLPNKKKRDRGQSVATAALRKGCNRFHDLGLLRSHFAPSQPQKPPARAVIEVLEQPQDETPTVVQSATVIDLTDLHPDLVELIRDGVPIGERSEKFHHVVGWLKDENYSAGAITNLLEAHPGGIAKKYKGRLEGEVKRCFDKAENKTTNQYPAHNPEGGIRIWRIEELLNRPPPSFLIEGILPEKGVALMAGGSGHMKSFLAIHYGLSIATGLRGGQYDVKKQGGVLYLLNEGAAGVPYRAQAWRDHYNQPDTDLFGIVETTPNLMKPDSVDPYIKAVEDVGIPPVLIIIDSLSKATIGGEENSAKDMAAAIHSAEMMARHFNCLVLLIDHIGKDKKKGLRGSSAKFANVDAVCIVNKTKGADDKITVTLTVDKQKDGEGGLTFAFAMELQPVGGKSYPVLVPTSGTSAKLKQPDWVRSKVSFAGFVERDQLEEQFLEEYPDSTKSSFRSVLSRLLNAGFLNEFDGLIRELDDPEAPRQPRNP
jgi:hypothetical protein